MKQQTNFAVGQVVKQNGYPDLFIIITEVDEGKSEFSGVVLVNEFNTYECEVGENVGGQEFSNFQALTKPQTFGIGKQQKFQVGDFVRHNDMSDDTHWTGLVTNVNKTTFGMVVITTTSSHIYPGDEFGCEDYDMWELAEITVEPPVWEFRVGDRVSSNLIHGDNMLTITAVSTDEVNSLTAVVVRNPMNPAQEGTIYSGLLPSTFTPYKTI